MFDITSDFHIVTVVVTVNIKKLVHRESPNQSPYIKWCNVTNTS